MRPGVLLLQWTAAAPATSVGSSRQFLELVDRYATDRRFFDDDPVTQLERLGVTESDFTASEPWDQCRSPRPAGRPLAVYETQVTGAASASGCDLKT